MNTELTTFCSLSKEKIVLACSELTATPALLILFILSHLIFIIVGSSMVENKKLFFKIWVISFAFSAMILLGLIFLPTTLQQILSSLG